MIEVLKLEKQLFLSKIFNALATFQTNQAIPLRTIGNIPLRNIQKIRFLRILVHLQRSTPETLKLVKANLTKNLLPSLVSRNNLQGFALKGFENYFFLVFL
ncbi:UNKNOWN [Stylonychia lemnae]|uniref:Uncharacterized protein n=1 Tax=Stylonychia lemnae TaxID=5949 RepID=A0A078B9H5_STYLE|nr:UNKNOWN [Stylonychia lemnae]|eukprot:CDW91074.1 UNKNOWN [Stylonychia lemnae]